MPLTCSLIINTYNRANYLRKLLPGLSHLENVRFEVIVVNGPSTDDTEDVLQEYAGRIKNVSCPVCNLSVSRNIGIAHAAGDLVVFLDDDALPADALWLQRFADAFEKQEDLAALGGKVLVGDTEWVEYNGGLTTCYGFQHFDCSQKESSPPDGEQWILRVPGGNCAYHRQKLIAIGGFDEYYKYYADETDVCLRFFQRNDAIAHLEDNPIRHYPQRVFGSNKGLAQKYRVITRSDTYFALKNSSGPRWKRLIRTLRYARKKHFYADIQEGWKNKSFTRKEYGLILANWTYGLICGALTGLFQQRRTASFDQPPPPFLPYGTTADPSRKLRIGLLSQSLPIHENYGGVSRYVYDLAWGLHERGHRVELFCKDAKPIQRMAMDFVVHGITSAEYENASIFPDKPVLNKNTAYSLAVERRIKALEEDGDTLDVIHATNWDAEGAAILKRGATPVVLLLVTSLAQDVQEMRWDWNADMKASVALDYWQITHAARICAPSQGVLDSYINLMNIPEKTLRNVDVVPLGIVPDTSNAPRMDDRKNILFVGRCERRKGVHNLLAVLPELLTEHADWVCHLVGNDQILNERNTTYKDEFIEQHKDAPWLNRVLFHGFVDEEELKRFYRDCDLFVAPSLFESFGLIYLEAMQYGKAVVGCRVGGVPETIGDEAGVLIDPDSPSQLLAAVNRLMKGSTERTAMGQHGLQRVREYLNYQSMAERYEGVYLKAVANEPISRSS